MDVFLIFGNPSNIYSPNHAIMQLESLGLYLSDNNGMVKNVFILQRHHSRFRKTNPSIPIDTDTWMILPVIKIWDRIIFISTSNDAFLQFLKIALLSHINVYPNILDPRSWLLRSKTYKAIVIMPSKVLKFYLWGCNFISF